MTGLEALRCTKNFPHSGSDQATELLLLRHFADNEWSVKPRCAEHPAADDIPMLQRIQPALVCVIVPLGGAR